MRKNANADAHALADTTRRGTVRVSGARRGRSKNWNGVGLKTGFHGVKVTEVLGRADAPAGSMYHHFPGGKPDLVAAAVRTVGADRQRLLERLIRQHRTPGAAVAAFFNAQAVALEMQGFASGCPVGQPAADGAASSEEVRAAAGDTFDGWAGVMGDVLRARGVKRGRAQSLAYFVIATYQGAIQLARVQRDADIVRFAGRELALLIDPAPEVPKKRSKK